MMYCEDANKTLDQPAASAEYQTAIRLRLGGQVQGVGFRPFVYRLARQLGIRGWVENRRGEVWIQAEGEAGNIERFIHDLFAQAPRIARPILRHRSMVASEALDGFAIRESECPSGDADRDGAGIPVPADQAVCADCLAEMKDPANRRHRHPFINCTQCGPRYSLITSLPYDRANTAMAAFTLCADCRREYTDPADRRFHAQPIACPRCGPQLVFVHGEKTVPGNEAALQQASAVLREGGILAVKGIGGYHLLCDARNDAAVARLRQRKHRPHRPLAVMFPPRGGDGLDAIREHVAVDEQAAELLGSAVRPIVLLQRHDKPLAEKDRLSPRIAPGVSLLGVMLPYSPLHHLLLQDFAAPLVATSANLAGEPVITDVAEAESDLAGIADAFLHHDRPIVQAADDSVYRIIHGQARALRIGRGLAPLELQLPMTLEKPVLAVGGQMKNTVALAWQDRLVVSPHIGDLDSPRSLQRFHQTIAHLLELYGIRPAVIVADAHPGYRSHREARQMADDWQASFVPVFHHHAHAASVVLEQGEAAGERPWLVFTWDGSGYGEDGHLWGGEALLGRPGNWRRVAGFRPFYLPGGERAARQPWRSAAALCWQAGQDCPGIPEHDLIRQAWHKRLNCPRTTSAGRLFDGAAALTGLLDHYSFEGQGPMWLEARAGRAGSESPLPLARNAEGWLQADWAPLLDMLRDPGQEMAQRAARFHGIMAATLVAQARRLREQHGEFRVGLSGGVFQNRLLAEQAIALLEAEGFEVALNRRLPCNDGGLSAGQVLEAAARRETA